LNAPGSQNAFELAYQRLATRDESDSDRLSRMLGLKSWRDAHPSEVPTPALCRCGCLDPVPPFMRSGYASTKCRRKDAMRQQRAAGPKEMAQGARFGSRTIIVEAAIRTAGGHRMYRVRCDCGRVDTVMGMKLRSGLANQCAECARARG
jgi:hypothetical protein